MGVGEAVQGQPGTHQQERNVMVRNLLRKDKIEAREVEKDE